MPADRAGAAKPSRRRALAALGSTAIAVRLGLGDDRLEGGSYAITSNRDGRLGGSPREDDVLVRLNVDYRRSIR